MAREGGLKQDLVKDGTRHSRGEVFVGYDLDGTLEAIRLADSTMNRRLGSGIDLQRVRRMRDSVCVCE